MGYEFARIYLFGIIPLQRKSRLLQVHGPFEKFRWWEGFKQYRTWVQILVLVKVFKLKIIELK